jgi:protoporphyrinogen/coproporphyrinogen III oxidase
MSSLDADVIVVGGGIAGLAAAYRLKRHGCAPIVLEANAWVGGRMRTDRVGGYHIDAGVTLLGRRYHRMRALVHELSLDRLTQPVPFSLAIDGRDRSRLFPAARRDSLLLSGNLSLRQKAALSRVGFDLLRYGRVLRHGQADQCATLDDRSAADYLESLGRGGAELLDEVFEPGLRAAMGGDVRGTSRQVLLTVVYNTLDAGFWNFQGAVDVLSQALAATVEVRLRTEAIAVLRQPTGVTVEVDDGRGRAALRARGALLAVPGNRIPGLASWLPEWLSAPLSQTGFSRLSSLHLGLRRVPSATEVGVAFVDGASGIGVLELEHRRAPGRCPEGKAMVSVYFVNSPGFDCVDASDSELTERAMAVMRSRFPEVADDVELIHRVAWPTGIALFPTGRVQQMGALRRRLAGWDQPLEIAGDWLDGVASESALRTGEQAADRLAKRLG